METVTIDQLVPGGQGIGTLASGKKAFVWGALPGETVEIQITKDKSSYCEAVASKILTKNKRRVNPRDPCYLSTSPWQIMDYAYELEQKSLITAECFRQAELLDYIPKNKVPLPITDNLDYFYRNKMEYSLYWNNQTNQIEPAFHARGTHTKIPIQKSSIERPEIFAAAQKIIASLNKEHQPARKYQSLLVRCNQQGIISSALFENHKPHPKMSPLTDQLLGRTYSYSPNGFFQVNLPVYELALKAIKNHITTSKVLDLYAGVGTIGLSVASDRALTLVEVDQSAFAELSKNAATSKNTKTILAKSEEVLDFITSDTTVILDPPRAGVDKKLIAKLAATGATTIIYLSCNPITQARDLKLLHSAAPKLYKVSAFQPFNFFPRTNHIENLVVLNLASTIKT